MTLIDFLCAYVGIGLCIVLMNILFASEGKWDQLRLANRNFGPLKIIAIFTVVGILATAFWPIYAVALLALRKPKRR